ncbi:unnamed protein product [Sphagnum troendelagicum]|uniref:Protein kinase domain-containing protein n=1 Tax=Sphagnum troendelagicum TaxID=128251 RepID=A0ABP0V0T3_9BRYO
MKTDTKLEINVGTGGKLVMFQSGVIVPSSREMFRAISRVRKRDIVGEGAYGVVYKLVLKDDSVFAVKKLKQCLENQRSFENELNTLATVKHRNLVRLRGFCTAPQSKLLIYDFLPNGSVDELLHEKSTELKVVNWVIRYRVAIGVARGLAYLHHGCDPSIIHGDISSTNILLDHHFEPHISDFGLAKLLDSSDTHITATVGGTFGYIAPEYAKTGQATEKVDVYSYGVLLLEILSGRRPTDDFFTVTEDHVNLAGWVRNLCKEGHESDVVDTYLKDRTPYEELRLLLEVACQCVSLLPQDRPSMTKVVEALETLTDNIESVSSSSCLQTPNSELWRSVGETTSFNSGSFRFCNELFNQADVLEAGFVGIKGEPFLFDLAL